MNTAPQMIIRTNLSGQEASVVSVIKQRNYGRTQESAEADVSSIEVLYRSRAGKQIIVRNGNYVEVTPAEKSERILFPVSR